MAKVYYIGDWAVMTGPVFAETPFNYSPKGLEIFNYGTWLKTALESTGEHQVESVPTWDFYRLAPGEWEKVLDDYDVFIFSDVEAKNFQLAPDFFNRSKFGKQPLTYPDRVRLTVEAIQGGKHSIFCGGWLSFNGEMGKGGWGRTGLKEVLPVNCLTQEDLVESTEGFTAVVKDPDGSFSGIDFSTFPPILGYNKVDIKPGFEVLLEVAETGDPLLSFGLCGKGNVMAYMSDPAPHWGCNFVYWEHYNQFWITLIRMLLDG